jgi:hypothetical protein
MGDKDLKTGSLVKVVNVVNGVLIVVAADDNVEKEDDK